MATSSVALRWTGVGLAFRGGAAGGPEIPLDGRGEAGASPVQALLLALAACMAADVVDILGKMQVPLAGLDVEVEGERAETHPRRFTAIRLRFRAQGVPPEAGAKLQRAIDLSREKYCSVLHTLRPDVVVESEAALQ